MKAYTLKFISLVTTALLCVMAYNYVFDSSGLFNTDFSQPRVEPNQHFVKMRYLLANPDKYDAYCFGSSRVGNIDLTEINNGYRYYNMTYSEGLPHEWLDDIKILVNHHVQVRQIMLGIDDFSFRVDPALHESQYLRIPYQENNTKTYLSYLLRMPSKPAKADEKGSIFDIYASGRPLHPQPDAEIEADPAKHLADEKFKKPMMYGGNRVKQTIADLRAIKAICEQNEIKLIVFINPINLVTYHANNLAEFNEFKRELAQVTDYYDFSGKNEITENNYYYYETSHYRPLVGDMIVHRIFAMPQEADVSFGRWVTKENVEEHLASLAKK